MPGSKIGAATIIFPIAITGWFRPFWPAPFLLLRGWLGRLWRRIRICFRLRLVRWLWVFRCHHCPLHFENGCYGGTIISALLLIWASDEVWTRCGFLVYCLWHG